MKRLTWFRIVFYTAAYGSAATIIALGWYSGWWNALLTP